MYDAVTAAQLINDESSSRIKWYCADEEAEEVLKCHVYLMAPSVLLDWEKFAVKAPSEWFLESEKAT